MNPIKWYSIREPATDEMVSEIEKTLGYKLPSDYVQYAKKYHGSLTSGNEFVYKTEDAKDHIGGMAQLLSFDLKKPNGSIVVCNEDLSYSIPHGLVAFAVDGGDGYVCFDYRGDKDNPNIVFWILGDEDVYLLAQSFSDFIEKLNKT